MELLLLKALTQVSSFVIKYALHLGCVEKYLLRENRILSADGAESLYKE